MAQGFLPGNPKTGDIDSFFMKSWFKQIADFCKRAFGLADIQVTTFSATDLEFYPCNTASGNIVVTLPTCLGINGRPYTFKKTSAANTLTIQPSGTDTIEGAASYVMTANGATVSFRSDGQTIWYIHSVGGTTGFLASPLTTKGDLWGYSTVDARVPVGTDGKVLTADSGAAEGVSWQTSSSGAPTDATYVTLTTNATLTNERPLVAGSNITITDAGAGVGVTVAASLGTAPGITLGQAVALVAGFAGP